ncbi:hypothetical protein WJX73_003767 [Symbiochloris irregularis]|uniref:Uncharacterized protein n=1 Tax=Symbiochloris irregularis TaxID=706552 RepID=A0AAW1NV53_9CHLO
MRSASQRWIKAERSWDCQAKHASRGIMSTRLALRLVRHLQYANMAAWSERSTDTLQRVWSHLQEVAKGASQKLEGGARAQQEPKAEPHARTPKPGQPVEAQQESDAPPWNLEDWTASTFPAPFSTLGPQVADKRNSWSPEPNPGSEQHANQHVNAKEHEPSAQDHEPSLPNAAKPPTPSQSAKPDLTPAVRYTLWQSYIASTKAWEQQLAVMSLLRSQYPAMARWPKQQAVLPQPLASEGPLVPALPKGSINFSLFDAEPSDVPFPKIVKRVDDSTRLASQLGRAQSNFKCQEISVLDNSNGHLDNLSDRLGYTFKNPQLVQSLAFVVVPRSICHQTSIKGNEGLSKIGQQILVKVLIIEMLGRYQDLIDPEDHAKWAVHLGLPGYAVWPGRSDNQGLTQLEISGLTTALFGALLLDGDVEAVHQVLLNILDWPEPADRKKFRVHLDLFDIVPRARRPVAAAAGDAGTTSNAPGPGPAATPADPSLPIEQKSVLPKDDSSTVSDEAKWHKKAPRSAPQRRQQPPRSASQRSHREC